MDYAISRPLAKPTVGHSFTAVVHMWLSVIVVLWMNFGIFSYVAVHVPSAVRWGLFAAWFLMAFTNRTFLNTFIRQSWPLLYFTLYLIVIDSFSSFDDAGSYLKIFLNLAMVYAIFLYYSDSTYIRYQKALVIALFIDTVFVSINTYVHLLENPDLARVLSTGVDVQQAALGDATYVGIGAFSFFYAVVPIILLLGYLLLHHRKYKLLTLLTMIGLALVLIKAAFTISILLTSAFLIGMIAFRYLNKTLVIVVGSIGLLMSTKLLDGLSKLLYHLSTYTNIPFAVSERLIELSFFLSGNSTTGDSDLEGRFNRYTLSLNTIVRHPIFGNAMGYHDTIGGHSSWLDYWAQFGIFFAFIILFMIKTYRYTQSLTLQIGKPFIRIYWIYFAILGIVNPLMFTNLFIIWFLFLPYAVNVFFNSRRYVGVPATVDNAPVLSTTTL